MIPEEAFRLVLKGLTEKSKKNQVNWQCGDSSRVSRNFFVQLPNSKIDIGFFTPQSDPDWCGAWLENGEGQALARLVANDGEAAFPLLKALYDEAERSVTRWDSVLHEVQTELDSDRIIGSPSSEIPF